MSYDGGTLATWVAIAAYGTLAAATQEEVLSGHEMIAVSCSTGLVGGFLSTFGGTANITLRTLIHRMGASGLAAPAIVSVWIVQAGIEPTVANVFASSGVAGIVAYPISQALPNLSLQWIKDMLRRFTGVGKDGS